MLTLSLVLISNGEVGAYIRAGLFMACPHRHFVLYRCETWSLILMEEHRLKVFENRVLRRIFGPKRDEVTGAWRKIINEDLNDLYGSPCIVRVI